MVAKDIQRIAHDGWDEFGGLPHAPAHAYTHEKNLKNAPVYMFVEPSQQSAIRSATQSATQSANNPQIIRSSLFGNFSFQVAKKGVRR